MGLAFKENCPDLRNTRVVDVVKELESYGCQVDIFDPWVDSKEAHSEYGVTPVNIPYEGNYDAVVLAVAHRQFKEMGIEAIRALAKPQHVLFDIKYILDADSVDGRL